MAHELPAIPLPPDWYWHADTDDAGRTEINLFAAHSKKPNQKTVAQRYSNGCWVAAYLNSRNDRLNKREAWAPDVYCANKEEALALAASYAWLNLQGE